MNLSVSNFASYYYNVYNNKNTDTNKENKIAESTISKDRYNISSISSVIDSFEKANSVSLYAIGNAYTYAKNSINLSQSTIYKKSEESSGSNTADLLQNNSVMSGLYNKLSTYSTVSTDYFNFYSRESSKTSNNNSINTAINSYNKYLSENTAKGSVLNIIA